MKVNPNKKSQPPLDKTVVVTIAVIALILILITVISNACSSKENEPSAGTFPDTDVTGSPSSGDTAKGDGTEKTDENGTSDDFIFIPIDPPDASAPSLAVTEAELNSALLSLTQDLGEGQIEKYHFLCDYVIYGMRSLGMLPDGTKTDRVITGASSSLSLMSGADTLVYLPNEDKILSACDAMSQIRPEYLLLSIGTDTVLEKTNISDTDFYNSYRELVMSLREASPETVIVCMPILPGSDGSGLNIYKAEEYNKYIHASAAEYGAYYIDIASAFANASGYMRIDCDAGESRLNTTGLRRLLELIRTYGVPTVDAEETTAEE